MPFSCLRCGIRSVNLWFPALIGPGAESKISRGWRHYYEDVDPGYKSVCFKSASVLQITNGYSQVFYRLVTVAILRFTGDLVEPQIIGKGYLSGDLYISLMNGSHSLLHALVSCLLLKHIVDWGIPIYLC
uniref:Uncharacterized protein LOC104217701 n=1 Tax=Nicotiana sylvestris TaxID=4096 RepID=A0A1U7VV87_NICSY|nr:PREDICTED: uncharacterized protein LOC104217701 [Nicotiana sylvestris]